jgi:hypothetical protein
VRATDQKREAPEMTFIKERTKYIASCDQCDWDSPDSHSKWERADRDRMDHETSPEHLIAIGVENVE